MLTPFEMSNKSGGLYHQEIIGQLSTVNYQLIVSAKTYLKR
jgi:hypothetical protein